MGIVRLFWVLVVAAGVAISPVSTAMLMSHAAKADVGASAAGDDCPCCKPAKVDPCPTACCYLQAVAAEGWAIARPVSPWFGAQESDTVLPIAHQPDPPPPRG
jgi:uncharacterized protein involved in high-affinity Fe2+ transport